MGGKVLKTRGQEIQQAFRSKERLVAFVYPQRKMLLAKEGIWDYNRIREDCLKGR